MKVIPFHANHVRLMNLQPTQRWALSVLPPEYLTALNRLGSAVSAEHEGKIIACAGVAIQGFGAGTLWGFVSHDAGPYFIRLDRCVRRLLTIRPLRRIEASAEVDFRPGCRWLELLGFQSEGVMRSYGPNGEDHMRYART